MKAKYLMIAAITTLLAACSNDENEVNNGPVEARVTAGVDAPKTRAVDNVWSVSDRIGVRVASVSGTTEGIASSMAEKYKNVQYSISSLADNSHTATFTATTTGNGIFFQDANETVTFTAYAPYQSSEGANLLPDTEGVINVNTGANKNTETNQEKIDFLFAEGATASKRLPTVEFKAGGTDCSFKHKMARLILVLKTSTDDGFTASQIFNSANVFTLKGLKHSGTFNVTNGQAVVTGTATDLNITGLRHNDVNNTRTYTLILLPQTGINAMKLSIVIDGQTYTTATSAFSNTLDAGKSYQYNITVKKQGLKVDGCTITSWEAVHTGSGDATME